VAAAAVVALVSRGDVVVLAVLLGLAAASAIAGAAAAVALGAATVRWGTSSLGAIAGDQAVLGVAGATGSSAAIASAWIAAVALLLAVPPRPSVAGWRGRVHAVPFGLAAAAVVAGPGPGGDLAWRVAASAVLVAVACWSAPIGHRLRPVVALGAGCIAVGLAVAGT
jgi:hypothetical protein